MASARRQLADWLQEQLGAGVRVLDNPRTVDPVPAVMVQIVRTSVRHPNEAPAGAWANALDVWVVVGSTDPAKGEDALDDAVDRVLEALDGNGWLLWESAERATYNDTNLAYRIPVTLKTKQTPGG